MPRKPAALPRVLCCRLSDDEYAAFAALAEQERRTPGQLLRIMVQDKLAGQQRKRGKGKS